MIGDAILREIVCADLFRAVSRAYLRLTVSGALARLAFVLRLLQFACEELHRLFLVLRLRALARAFHVHASWLVNDTHRGLSFVHILASCAHGARCLSLDIRPAYLHFGSLFYFQYCH